MSEPKLVIAIKHFPHEIFCTLCHAIIGYTIHSKILGGIVLSKGSIRVDGTYPKPGDEIKCGCNECYPLNLTIRKRTKPLPYPAEKAQNGLKTAKSGERVEGEGRGHYSPINHERMKNFIIFVLIVVIALLIARLYKTYELNTSYYDRNSITFVK